MKRLAIALAITVGLAILAPGFAAIAQSTLIPHEDPAAAKKTVDPIALIVSYSSVFDLIAIKQYQDAQSILNELKHANIPDELRYVIDRYNTLSQQLVTSLDNLDSLLDEASTLLSQNQVSDAEQKLDDAEASIYNAQLLLRDIDTATDMITDKLGAFATPSLFKQLQQAQERLEQSLRRLRQLINELIQIRQSLADRQQTQEVTLIPTELSLSANPASAFIGDIITASGRLLSDDKVLTGRQLILLLNDKPLVTTTTDPDGSHTTDITIPYEYVSTATLTAEYVPSGDDTGIYQAARSPPVLINTLFYPTVLEVSAPEIAPPGLPFTISGQVSSTGGSTERTIRVILDDTPLVQETVQGQFNLEVTPPPQTSTGEHSLTVVAAPQERYCGASKSLIINIARIPVQTEVQMPELVIMPRAVEISGKVSYNLAPVKDARVSVAYRESLNTAKTAADGSFKLVMQPHQQSVSWNNIELPLDLSLIGPQELTITVEPAEPWYAPSQIKKGVFIVNLANMGLMLCAFLVIGLVVYTQARTRVPKQRKERVTPHPQVQELPAAAPPPGPRYELTGTRGRILSAYTTGLEVVEKTTGITMAPHTTLREFLKIATPKIPTAARPFTELTTMTEIALYSTHELDEDTATGAEQLAATIREELQSGTS